MIAASPGGLDQVIDLFQRGWSADPRLRERADRLVVFGGGSTGAMVIRGLRAAGIAPVAVIDNDPQRCGGQLLGIPVRPAAEAATGLGGEAAVIVAVSTVAYGVLAEGLRRQGWTTIACLGGLFRTWPQAFLPHFHADVPGNYRSHAAAIEQADRLWSDAASRATYRRQLHWRATLDADRLGPLCEGEPYFPDEIPFIADEALVDAGAFTGDTVQAFLRLTGNRFAWIDAIEADAANLAQLARWRGGLSPGLAERIQLHPVAAHDRAGTLRFAAGDGAESHVAASGGIAVRAETIDALLAGRRPTWLKFDVEGAEPAALTGCSATLAMSRPVVAVSVYHRPDHLWSLPLWLEARLPDYRWLLRAYHGYGYDVVAYGVPAERMG